MFNMESSGTAEIFNLAKKLENEGKKLIHLEVGELDIETPKYILDATVNAISQNFTKYTETKGIPGLRNEIAKYIKNRYNTEFINPNENIMVTPGAKFGIFAALLSFLSPGDEIIVFSPSYPSYRSVPKAINIKVREIPILRGSKILPMDEIIEDLRSKLNEKTRFFILNGPCNPTGQVIYPSTLDKVWELCEKYPRILFLADDIYEQFIYPPATFETTVKFDPKLERTIIINGFSKQFAMTGFRLAFVVSKKEIIDTLVKFQQNSITCATSFVQKAGEIALKSCNENWEEYQSFRENIINSLKEKRDFVYNSLKNVKNIDLNKPEGAFYVFPDISKLNITSHEFSMKLLSKGVVTTPGIAFGENGENHIRICYSRPMEELKRAISIIEQVISELS